MSSELTLLRIKIASMCERQDRKGLGGHINFQLPGRPRRAPTSSLPQARRSGETKDAADHPGVSPPTLLI
jgi:hypothetical protein